MSSLLIRDVVVGSQRTSILCADGRIAAIGEEAERAAAVGGEAAEVLDGRGCLAQAPLINSHTHAAMTLFRGHGDSLPLLEWLHTRVWPYEEQITDEEVYAGTRLAIVEMVRSGTVLFNDSYWDFDGVARAVEEMGVRAYVGQAMIDLGDADLARRQRAENEQLLARAGQYGARVKMAVAPHAVYTVCEESLRWAAEFSSEHDLVLHIHVSETEAEVSDCYREHGCSPVQYLDRLGVLSQRTVAAHTVWLSDHDVAILGERGVVCVNCPVSNMKLAVGGVYPHRRLAAAGAVCAIGTDGAGSNNSLDLFQELKFASLMQKHHERDATALPAKEALETAIANPAAVFGQPGPNLEVGRIADLILIDSEQPEMLPRHSLSSHLVFSATGGVVDSVVCDGRVVMHHRQIDGEQEIAAAAEEAARRLFGRVGGVSARR